ncbi:MAG: threonine synthase [Gemmatimonadales bacterium]|nr:MAG: threonine synthase [Gemmatimonadales bacterium]
MLRPGGRGFQEGFVQARSSRESGPVGLVQSLEEGLAPDGGLYMPMEWPALPPPPPSLGETLSDTAAWAAPHLVEGMLQRSELEAVAREALNFPVPLTSLDGRIQLLELFHGPTLAFKDVGARFLARVWSRLEDPTPRTVLVATSGDTGGAVARACHGLAGVRVVVLFPKGRVSDVQRRQFTTLGGNVVAVQVDGPFDRCQQLVKAALRDPTLRRRHRLTSANSINLGRLLPQVFYYLHLARLEGWGKGEPARRPVIVPSGNLGNITAGVLASRTGAPLGSLVAALNANDALLRYCREGVVRDAPVRRTLATAMDVAHPSNLERLEDLFGYDPSRLQAALNPTSVPDEEVEAAIRWAWTTCGTHLDPHTAVGVAVARREPWSAGRVTVLATAHPAKFPRVVERCTGVPVPAHPRLSAEARLPEVVLSLEGDLEALDAVLSGAGDPYRCEEGT